MRSSLGRRLTPPSLRLGCRLTPVSDLMSTSDSSAASSAVLIARHAAGARPEGSDEPPSVPAASECTDRTHPVLDAGGRRPRKAGLPQTRQGEDHRRLGVVTRLVRTGSQVGVDEGGCSPTRARARCACRLSRIRPAASTPAAPAIAAKEGSRCGRSRRRTVEGMEMRTFGQQQVSGHARVETCIAGRSQAVAAPPGRVSESLTNEVRCGDAKGSLPGRGCEGCDLGAASGRGERG